MFLHGSFDFVLFLMGAIEFIYDEESLLLEIVTMGGALLIAIGGTVWAYKSFSSVQAAFEQGGGWQGVSNTELVVGDGNL